MIITIDGPSGTGKSTVAKKVAQCLGFTFFDTGAMYRCFAWKIRAKGIDPESELDVVSEVASFHFEIKTDNGGERVYFVDEQDVTESIRTREISTLSSRIAVYQGVRNHMVKFQRRFGRSCDAVFEGRDMGTVVFPDADLKIFLNAKPTVRAERRYCELLAKFPDANRPTLEQILQEIHARDQNDTMRVLSPLKPAEDAIVIDTSDISIEEVVEKIIRLKPKKRFLKMKFSYWLVYTLAKSFFRIFYRLRVYGEKHIKPGAGLLIANHTSFYDPPILSVSCTEEVHFLARDSLFRIPLLGRLIKMLNTHPVSRDATDMNVLRQMIRLLQEGNKLIIFPEGKRSPNGEMRELKPGFSFLAKKAKATIYPAYIEGAYQAWPSSKKMPRLFGKVRCVFGSPIVWEDFEHFPKDEVEKKLAEKCGVAILRLKKWLEEGAHGIPP